jgi:hypothetical protein
LDGGRTGVRPEPAKALSSICGMLVSSMTMGHAIELGLPIDCDVGRNCVIQQYVDHDLSLKARDYQLAR